MTKKEKIDQLLNQMTREERDTFLYKAMNVFVLFADHPDGDKIVAERLSKYEQPTNYKKNGNFLK